MANMQISHSEWSFVTSVNLTYFESEAKYLEQTVANIQRLCDIIIEDFQLPIPSEYCAHTMAQLHSLMEETSEFSAKWFMQQEFDVNAFHRTNRKKRSFFGTISKRLFFSMSEDDAEIYRNQINTLKTENMDHMLFAKNQTTLFQETIKVLNNTMQLQIVQHTALQRQFDDLDLLLNNATVSNKLTAKLNELMHYTLSVITGFREKQRYLFDSITSNSKAFELISPKMFTTELNRVKNLIGSQGLHLPLSLTATNLPKFYQMITTEVRLTDHSLVLRFTIPLVESRAFILYKALSMPHRYENDTFEYIVPHNEYIAYNSLDETFVVLTPDEHRNCHQIDMKNIVCKQTFPVRLAPDDTGCEINLVRRQNITSDCDVRHSNVTREIWVKLQQPNTYLFTMPKLQQAIVSCPNARTKLFIQDSGVISLAPKCRIKTERVEIVAFQTIETKNSHPFAPSVKLNVNVSAEVEGAKQTKGLSNPKLPSHISSEDVRKIQEINDNVNNLQAQNTIRASIDLFRTNTDDISPVLLAIVSIAVIVVAIVAIFVCFKYCAVPGCNIILFIGFAALVVSGIIYFI